MTNAESCRDPHASAAPASASGRRHLRRLLLAATAAGTLLATSVGATTHGLIDWQSGWGQLQTWWTGALPGVRETRTYAVMEEVKNTALLAI